MTPEQRREIAGRLAGLDVLELEIDRLVTGGEGMGRFEGIPVFVPRSTPGDRLRVRIVERRSGYARAEIETVLRPGPARRPAPCPHFEHCGGCDLQHIEDGAQTAYKVASVRETLERLGGIRWPATAGVRRADAWGYRLRTSLHTEPLGEGTRVGYRARRSHQLVSVDRCPVLVPELEAVVGGLGRRLPAPAPRRIDLAAGDPGTWTAAPLLENLAHGEVELHAAGLCYAYDARCFFQAHRGLVESLINTAVGDWRGGRAVDLYAGVGHFSLPLARHYDEVMGVEVDRIAVRHARRNARHNGVTNLRVEQAAVERWVAGLPPDLDRVLVDPPRSGLPGVVRHALRARAPERITYVSCDAATLARDRRELTIDYAVEALTVLDLFPQTGHVETVVQLVRGPESTETREGGPPAGC